jgi:hypothetical protein
MKYIKEIMIAFLTLILGLSITLGMFILKDVNAEIKHNDRTIEKKEDKITHQRDVDRIDATLIRMEKKLDKILTEVKK